MYKIATVCVSGVSAVVVDRKTIPRGITGAVVEFIYDDDLWEGLTKKVAFRGSEEVEKIYDSDTVIFPAEVAQQKNVRVSVGVTGVSADGTEVIPTLWAELGSVRDSAYGDYPAPGEPVPPVWAQILAMIGDPGNLDTEAKDDLVTAINEVLSKASAVSGGGITNTAITLLTSVLRNAVYTSDQSAAITALEKALAENASSGGSGGGGNGDADATLVSITVVYTGGKVPVGTSVADLDGIVVTAIYSDGSTQTVTDYTLSGTISEGSNTITVSYCGKNTTFIVAGFNDISDGYVTDGLEFRQDAIRNSGTLEANGNQSNWGDVSGNGWETSGSDATINPQGTYHEVRARAYIKIVDFASLLGKMANAFTVEMVFQPAPTVSQGKPVFSVGSGSTNHLITVSGQFRVLGNQSLYGTAMSDASKIRHLTLVYDGTKLAMYHDGVLDAKRTATFDISSYDDLELWGDREWSESVQGSFNAARIYSRALSESEIVANYENDIARFGTVNVEVE